MLFCCRAAEAPAAALLASWPSGQTADASQKAARATRQIFCSVVKAVPSTARVASAVPGGRIETMPAWIVALCMLLAAPAIGQQLEPRAYSNVPIGLNFLIAGYTYSSGGLATNPAQKLENADLDTHAPFVAYAHAFDAWGKSAKFDAVLGAACLSGSAEVDGTPVSRDVCGGLDPAFRVTVNLYGAPALTLPEFRNYRQDLIVGVSFQVVAPFGQYDESRLINLGANRWTFHPEVGVSKKLGALIVEGALGVRFFTDNDEFGGRTLEQDPIVSTQLHLIYEFRGGAWLALNGTYYTGGRTTVDGIQQNNELSNSRLGATLALPADRHNSVKLHASGGVSVRAGQDFRTVGIAWQYRWGGGL